MPPDPYEFRNKEFSYHTHSHRHVFQSLTTSKRLWYVMLKKQLDAMKG